MPKRILLIILILSSISIGQYKITNYVQKQNEISFNLVFENNISSINYNIDSNFTATKRIILGLPYSSNHIIAYKIIKTTQTSFLVKEISQVSYKVNNSNEELEQKIVSSIAENKVIENKGSFWYKGIFSLVLDVNQFTYNKEKHEISNIDEIQISIKYNPANQSSITSNYLIKEAEKDIFVNSSFINSKVNQIPNYEKNDSSGNWINYNQKYLKISIAEDAIYRIKYDDLAKYSFSPNLFDPRNLHLFSKGKEVPIYVYGENDGSFDNSDYIEFVGLRNMGGHHRELGKYGEPYNEYLGRYTDTTAYWLTYNNNLGKRVNIKPNKIVSVVDSIKYYKEIIHSEINAWLDFSCTSQTRRELPFWSENKTWNEGNFNVGVKEKTFTVSDVYPNKDFSIFVKVQDYVSDVVKNAHLVALGLNTNTKLYDSTYIDKYQKALLNVDLNSNMLTIGNNTLKINSFQTSATINTCLFDWFEIEYPRYINTINNRLKFSFPYLTGTTIKNFILKNVNVDSYSIWKYGSDNVKYELEKNNNGLSVTDSIGPNDKFIYASFDQIKKPIINYVKEFKNLRNTNNKADYIAITHENFINKVNDYTNTIKSRYNLDVKVVDIKDIYDEYSYGLFNPEAIKDFLKSTHNYWQDSKPKYVALIGDATYDYYGNKYSNGLVKYRAMNYVPSYGFPVSDNWFVIWDSTGAYIPQMNIGRIPVNSNEELDWYITKHVNSLDQKYDEWNKRYMFFSSGSSSDEYEIKSLRSTNQYIVDNYINSVPIGGEFYHFYKTIDPPTNFGPFTRQYFQDAINKGSVFISYLGHSGTQIWDNSITTPTQLSNQFSRYPMISDFGCSTVKYAEPDIDSFSELFTVAKDGQALAYIGNSSLGFSSTSLQMPKLFYKKILKESVLNLSEALRLSKLEMNNTLGTAEVFQVFMFTNTLIGDPLISLPIPQKPNLLIKEEQIKPNKDDLTDLSDDATVIINYNNWGKVADDSVKLRIIHLYNEKADTLFRTRKIPFYKDSLKIQIPIKNKAGYHKVSVLLDIDNKITEIYKEDNFAENSFYVASSLVRPLFNNIVNNGIKSSIRVLNPVTKPNSENIELTISNDSKFTDSKKYYYTLDTLLTTIPINGLTDSRRYWGVVKIKNETTNALPFSFYNNHENFIINDSISYSTCSMDNIVFRNNCLQLDSLKYKFYLFSAGFIDGQAAIISKNDTNYVPTPLVGHHVVLFEDKPPYKFVQYKYFNTLVGGENITNYISFLDTLSSKFLVAFAISDEGSPKDANLKSLIKSFGSKYINNVGWRSSWAMLGKKGAAVGSVPEVFAASGNGSVKIDSTVNSVYDIGKIITPEIGPSGKWNYLKNNLTLPTNSSAFVTPIGIKKDGSAEKLEKINLNDTIMDLSKINSLIYPKLKFEYNLSINSSKESPSFNSLEVNYNQAPELGTNYQVVKVSKDSVEQGEISQLAFKVFNVGESKANIFNVYVDVIDSENKTTRLFSETMDSLGVNKFKNFKINYNTYQTSGLIQYKISIDPENNILELYKDNNIYSIPVYVKPNSKKAQLFLTIDGGDIYDGDYISNKPNIKVELNDESVIPINDTSKVNLYLNGKRITYLNNQSNMNYSFSLENPKVIINYNPVLSDGDYTLKVIGKNATGEIIDSTGIVKKFSVKNNLEISGIYNYPNPFIKETYFTFKLTQIPDDLKIFIYTIAGRKIKEFTINQNELKFDFNKIYWDCKDSDGDNISNGVYLYKIIAKKGDKLITYTGKIAKVE